MKTTLFAAARLLSLAAVVAAIVFSFSGEKTIISETPFQTVLDAVTKNMDMSEMQEGNNQMIRRLYGISPADYEACFLYYPSTNMGAQEMLLVKQRDASGTETLKAAAEQRIQDQLKVFEGYGVEQVALLKNHAVIETPGNYFLFVVNNKAESASAAFNEVL